MGVTNCRLPRRPFIPTPVEMNCAIDAIDEMQSSASNVHRVWVACRWVCLSLPRRCWLLHMSTRRRLDFPHLFPRARISCGARNTNDKAFSDDSIVDLASKLRIKTKVVRFKLK